MPNWWPMVALSACMCAMVRLPAHGDDSGGIVKVLERGRVVLDAAPDHLISPCVLRDGENMRMWYARTHFFTDDDPLFDEMPWLRGERHTWFIEHAVSTDGLTWADHKRVLGPGVADGMRLTQVHQPCVIRDGEGFRMWFIGREKDTDLYRMFHSYSPNGIVWEEPTLARDLGEEGSLYDRSVSGGSVIAEGGRCRMWFGGMSAEDGKCRTLRTESPDGLSWSPPGLAVDAGEPNDPDSRRAYRPCVIPLVERLLMLYCGIGDDSLRGPYVTMLATSADGVVWRKHGLAMDVGEPGEPDELRCYDAWMLPVDERTIRVWYIGAAADHFRRICHARLEIAPDA